MAQERPRTPEEPRSKQGCFGKCSHVFISQGRNGEGRSPIRCHQMRHSEPQTGQLQDLVLGRAWPLGTARGTERELAEGTAFHLGPHTPLATEAWPPPCLQQSRPDPGGQ